MLGAKHGFVQSVDCPVQSVDPCFALAVAPGAFLGFLETGQTLLVINFLLPSVVLRMCMH